jgi:hypothetical protein
MSCYDHCGGSSDGGLAEESQDYGRVLLIKVSSWFVGEDNGGLVNERARDSGALDLATRHLYWPAELLRLKFD